MNDAWDQQGYSTPDSTPSPPPIKQEDSPPSLSTEAALLPHLGTRSALAHANVKPSLLAQPVDKNRKSPCTYCRKVRRACRWNESSKLSSCERCLKAGRSCSGPTRRSQSNLEIAQSLRPLQTRQRVASIGPSSPEARWSSLHLSYSLGYHLAETGMSYLAKEFGDRGDNFITFVNRFERAQGRVDELGSTDEIFAFAQMIPGSHCTTHSAFFPGMTTVPAFEVASRLDPDCSATSNSNLGLARRPPLLSIIRIIAERVERQKLETKDQSLATLQISAWYHAFSNMVDLYELAPDRLHLLSFAIRQGFSFLRGFSTLQSVDIGFLGRFEEMVQEEIRWSLVEGTNSSISLRDYHFLLGRPSIPTIPEVPQDLSYVFSGAPEPVEVREAAFDFQDRWMNLAYPIYHHIEYLLTYTPAQKLRSAVAYCWDVLDKISTSLATCIDKILQDSRYTPNDTLLRPRTIVTNLIVIESDSLFILRGCHSVLEKLDRNSRDLLQSRRLWHDALTRSAERLAQLADCRRSIFGLHSHCVMFVSRLRSCPQHIFLEWGISFPHARDKMISGLRFVSYGSPDACWLIQQLEVCVSSQDW